MAINVNTVYRTVLSILNKEQRGYMTPQEFNTVATQVQLEIFEKYFDDLNQLLRVPNTDSDYADRVAHIEEKISIFKTVGDCVYVADPTGPYFALPLVDLYGDDNHVYRLGTLAYKNKYGVTIGPLEELQRGEFYYIQNSRITASTERHPTYIRENSRIIVAPSSITSGITANYIRKPLDPIWGFTVGTRGQYVYNPAPYNGAVVPATGSRNFEIHESDQITVILKILMYAGVIIKDPQVVQVAMQQSQVEEINSKS
jgi:hypothetical protein